MAKIIAPNKNYNGISAGVSFRDGIGNTEDRHLIAWFREHGYTVEAEPNPEAAAAQDLEKQSDPKLDQPANAEKKAKRKPKVKAAQQSKPESQSETTPEPGMAAEPETEAAAPESEIGQASAPDTDPDIQPDPEIKE